jgi:hypothetical protein
VEFSLYLPSSGFIYKTVPHVTLKSIANNPEIDEIYERMHPAIEQALGALNAVLSPSLQPSPINLLDQSSRVTAYAKNDHLGFQVWYLWNGVRRRFVPDFLIRLTNGKTLVLEIKGEDSEQNRAKRDALDVWVRAVKERGGFGVWCWDVAFAPAQLQDILAKNVA